MSELSEEPERLLGSKYTMPSTTLDGKVSREVSNGSPVIPE